MSRVIGIAWRVQRILSSIDMGNFFPLTVHMKSYTGMLVTEDEKGATLHVSPGLMGWNAPTRYTTLSRDTAG